MDNFTFILFRGVFKITFLLCFTKFDKIERPYISKEKSCCNGRGSDHAQEGSITPCLRVVNHSASVLRLVRFAYAFGAKYTSGQSAGVNTSGESIARHS
jgi:hypothetical protein